MSELTINGWTIYLHPQFLAALQSLVDEVRAAKAAHPDTYTSKRASKLLAATRKMAFVDIPADPTDAKFRQGGTLGGAYKNWFRGKYLQQFRLFFRYHEKQKIIVLAWMNDGDTKRAYGSKTDAYRVFAQMLDVGNPPDDWDELLAASTSDSADLPNSNAATGS